MRQIPVLSFFLILTAIFAFSCRKNSPSVTGVVSIKGVRAGDVPLIANAETKNVPVESIIMIEFSTSLDKSTILQSISLQSDDQTIVLCDVSSYNEDKAVRMMPVKPLRTNSKYTLKITNGIKGAGGEGCQGAVYRFITQDEKMTITSMTLNGTNFLNTPPLRDVSLKNLVLEINFSDALDSSTFKSFFAFFPGFAASYKLSDSDKKVTITNSVPLKYYTHYFFLISKDLTSVKGNPFNGFNNSFYTPLDTTPKFPLIPDEELLTLIQHATFRYFYDKAHPDCGMARERSTSEYIVTVGGSGFGVMALIVGMERGFITRQEGMTRLAKILNFLETCDRYHGAWPHWLNGVTGKTIAFTDKDDGADLVETSYMVEGLYTMRQYLDPSMTEEKQLIDRIDALTDAVEYDWFTRGQNVLYWHWSPNYNWDMNMQIRGYNEALITYIAAAASTTHGISADVYHQGYARNGAIQNGKSYYGYVLPLGEPYGGPLFFTHYSFLGLDPRNLQDQYAYYWTQNVNQSLINQAHCADNPGNWIGYSDQCWGLTASDDPEGYDAHSPANDNGTISPTAAVSALPYTPEQSLKAIRYFYYTVGDRLWGDYGFYDAFNVTYSWWADSYLAIDEGPVICMIENYRSQLLWNLFMSHPKVGPGLTKLGFSY